MYYLIEALLKKITLEKEQMTFSCESSLCLHWRKFTVVNNPAGSKPLAILRAPSDAAWFVLKLDNVTSMNY